MKLLEWGNLEQPNLIQTMWNKCLDHPETRLCDSLKRFITRLNAYCATFL